MAEGVASASGTVVAEGVYDDREHPPPPDPVKAPKGWTWDRKEQFWKPRLRGPALVQQPGPAAHQDPLPDDSSAPADERPGRDPDPGWARDTVPAGPAEQWELTAADRADIKALIALAYTLPAESLPLLDPYCFGPLGERKTGENIIDAVSDIVCGSPRVARWAASASGLMPWLKLSIALKPVAVAALHHHILRDVEVELDRAAKTMTVAKRDWAKYSAA